MAVDAAGEEDDGFESAGRRVLGGTDTGGLDYYVIDEAADGSEVAKEDEGEYGGGGREGGEEGGELEAEAGRAEEREWEDGD